MRFAMNENSLFAVLLRSSFVWSFALAGGMIALMMALLPEAYRVAGIVAGLPFAVIGCMALWRQLKLPSAARVERTTEAVRAMSWAEFKGALADAWRREGYDVRDVDGSAADFELRKEWRRSLVSCKRWKVGRTGVEPLRELVKAKELREAHDCMYVAVGEISDNARDFARKNAVALIGAAELARLMPKGTGKAAAPR
jgi:restriction system protein